ncbi:MAG: hypothetical protein ACJA01_003725 [Saprospiraceae bacterium]|jgi:hypothetical protein
MKIKTAVLIEELIERTKDHINTIHGLKELSDDKLNWKSGLDRWSILENLEHLNRYGYFYLPEIQNRINQSVSKASVEFKSGILGNYFAKSMLPKQKLNKMKTFDSMNPLNSNLDRTTIDRFLSQQRTTLDLLDAARQINLTKVKTSISISKFIKLRLGDTFRVIIYHNYRHMVQIQNVTEEYKRGK